METCAPAAGNKVRGRSNVVAHSKVASLRIRASVRLSASQKNGSDPKSPRSHILDSAVIEIPHGNMKNARNGKPSLSCGSFMALKSSTA